ncbi:MAG: zinc ribbon-containing protein [Candidatus Sedimenticola sp. PURPLELP]
MAPQEKRDPVDRMVDAYENMLERVDEMLASAEKNTLPMLRQSLKDAREKAVELGELTREESEKISGYLERDMKDAAHFLSDTGDDFREWFRFDMELIEGRMMDMFAKVADRTRLELDRFAEQARQASMYHTGEITGPGTLVCNQCGKELHFHKAGHIPPCPKCHATEYKRQED